MKGNDAIILYCPFVRMPELSCKVTRDASALPVGGTNLVPFLGVIS